jgi:hypothetical protein
VQKQHMLTASIHRSMVNQATSKRSELTYCGSCCSWITAVAAVAACRAEMACCSKGEDRSHKGLDKLTEEIVSTGKCSYTQVRAVLRVFTAPRCSQQFRMSAAQSAQQARGSRSSFGQQLTFQPRPAAAAASLSNRLRHAFRTPLNGMCHHTWCGMQRHPQPLPTDTIRRPSAYCVTTSCVVTHEIMHSGESRPCAALCLCAELPGGGSEDQRI